jgi:hypothetical protein
MVNPRYLLLLFAFAFLMIQVLSFISGARNHAAELEKLEELVLQIEQGAFFDIKLDPQNAIITEKRDFNRGAVGFAVKVALVIVATLFVYRLIIRYSGRRQAARNTE